MGVRVPYAHAETLHYQPASASTVVAPTSNKEKTQSSRIVIFFYSNYVFWCIQYPKCIQYVSHACDFSRTSYVFGNGLHNHAILSHQCYSINPVTITSKWGQVLSIPWYTNHTDTLRSTGVKD